MMNNAMELALINAGYGDMIDAQTKYVQPSRAVHADMAKTAKQAGQVFGKREVIKSSKGKHATNRKPPKKKRK